MVDLYLHSPLYLHCIVLNYLSTGTTLPFHYKSPLINLASFSKSMRLIMCSMPA
jgi:hypothetical protein